MKRNGGKEAYQLMKQIKQIFNPRNLLNPGVILKNDPEAHLKNLKPISEASEKIDKCIECGFCESTCVLAELTHTPRQQITVFSEMSRLAKTGDKPHISIALTKAYRYHGN